jgi:uncharacterized protein YciW
MAIARDFRHAKLDAKDKAMLEYAEKITLTPSAVDEREVERLKEAGWNEIEILDIAAVTSYRNFITRYASQLDIDIEDAEMDIRMTYGPPSRIGRSRDSIRPGLLPT